MTNIGHDPPTPAQAHPHPTRGLWFVLRLCLLLVAVWVAATERWDANEDGTISVHEVLLFGVRFLAFPLHVLLRLLPPSALALLGLPDAYWPSSALLAVIVSLPLWGLVLIGGLLAQAWLEKLSEARQARKLV